MKLKLIDGEPVCHKECEHYCDPHWCKAKYPPEEVHTQFTTPCIWGVMQQRKEAEQANRDAAYILNDLVEASKDALRLLDGLIHDLWGRKPDKEIFCNLEDAIKKAEGKS